MSLPKKCGPPIVLASSDGARITRCACGTVHMTMLNSGVTLRMSLEAFRGVAGAVKVATERLEDEARFGVTSIN